MNSVEKLNAVIAGTREMDPGNEEGARAQQLLQMAGPIAKQMLPSDPAELDRFLVGTAQFLLDLRSDDAAAQVIAPLPGMETGGPSTGTAPPVESPSPPAPESPGSATSSGTGSPGAPLTPVPDPVPPTPAPAEPTGSPDVTPDAGPGPTESAPATPPATPSPPAEPTPAASSPGSEPLPAPEGGDQGGTSEAG
jgi:hypothetical protein